MVLIVCSEWRGRGYSHSCSAGGSWALSQTGHWGRKGELLAQTVRGSSGPPCIFSTHRWMSPMPGRTITTGSETALCLQPTLTVLLFVGQLPLWGGLLPFFSDPPPSLPRSHNQCKGCSRDLWWFLTSPPQMFSLPHVASLGPAGLVPPWGLLLDGLTHSWSHGVTGTFLSRDGSSWIL